MEIKTFVEDLFKNSDANEETLVLKDKLVKNLYEKCYTYISEGVSKSEATEKAISEIKRTNKYVKALSEKKSLVKGAYRVDAATVIKSTPLEIIKKSKKRTRELHFAFSLVLWSGTFIFYWLINFALGYTSVAFNPTKVSWTWLIVFVAGIIECAVEIFFCERELVVLKENIDLRQINPNAEGKSDIDLHSYNNKLFKKLQLMSYAIVWIPLVFLYFIMGYISNLWFPALAIFVIGIFFEFLRNFLKKLKTFR